MGMQCFFKYEDLPDGVIFDHNHDIGSDTWSATIFFPEGPIIVSMSNPFNEGDVDYWFDVGHGTKEQLLKLQNLIRNRVCFICC